MVMATVTSVDQYQVQGETAPLLTEINTQVIRKQQRRECAVNISVSPQIPSGC